MPATPSTVSATCWTGVLAGSGTASTTGWAAARVVSTTFSIVPEVFGMGVEGVVGDGVDGVVVRPPEDGGVAAGGVVARGVSEPERGRADVSVVATRRP